jgi:murein DD-endopeptidase MepM/ murein hydrolase activator NlpD
MDRGQSTGQSAVVAIGGALAAALAIAVAPFAASCHREPAAPPPVPHRADIVLPVETRTIESLVPKQGTLDAILAQSDLAAPSVQATIESARSVFDVRKIRAQQPYRLVVSVDGSLREFEYRIDDDRYLRIVNRDRATPEKLDAEVRLYDKDRSIVAIRGRIDRETPSLFAAVASAGERVDFAVALAEIFSGQIDFDNDLQPGDSFEVLFETTKYKGEFAGYGPIMAAKFANDGKEYEAYRWVNPDTTKAAYYDEQGRSLRRFVLASPLRFTPRVTSGFSRRRMHPVYHTVRAHLGVDYAAPTGAPVVAVANGVVVSAGWAGGGGRQVHIRHTGGFESYYLHLSAFAKGIRAGAAVDQGQLVGRVGASGTATGPHLDYRLKKNGVFVDPRREHARQPPGEPIPAAYLNDFGTARDGLLQQISTTLTADSTPAPALAAVVVPPADGSKEKP